MADVIFPTGISNGTPATDDRIMFSDTSATNATKDCAISELPVSDATIASLALKQSTSEKGIANGYASLDSGGKVPTAQLPTGTGLGDVVGPATNSDLYIPQWDGVNSKTLKNGIPTSTFAPALGLDDNYVTDAEKIVIGNTSGTNTGDNATNSQYSGLATSKEDVANKSITLSADQASDTKYPSVKSVYDWATGLFATISNLALKAPLASPTFTGTVTTPAIKITTGAGASKVLTSDVNGDATWQTPSAGAGGEIRIRIPGEMVADTASYQGVFWRNTTGATITISNVKIGVAIAAAGAGAATAFNVYKSSGTAADGINTNAVNLFTSAIDLGTANTDDTNVPNTATVEDGRWVSLRCTSSAGATTKAQDCEVIIAYS